jgi:ankyrin repeat protein
VKQLKILLTVLFVMPIVGVYAAEEPDLPIAKAILARDRGAVRYYLENGQSANQRNKDGYPLIMLAAKKGNMAILNDLIEFGVNVNARNYNNRTALMMASQEGHLDVAQLLIENLADLNAQDDDGFTALMWADMYNDLRMVKLLVGNGAEQNYLTDHEGYPLLTRASLHGHARIVQFLLNNGAQAVDKNCNCVPALFYAINAGHIKVVKVFVEHFKNANLSVDGSTSALMAASFFGRTHIASFLIENHANVNARGPLGFTPLMSAVIGERNQAEMVQLLVNNKADVNVVLDDGFSALEAAKDKNRADIVKILKRAGAKR